MSRWNTFLPSIEASSSTTRSRSGRRSIRAAISAWIVEGSGMAGTSVVVQRPSLRQEISVDERREQLLDEERIAVGRSDDVRANGIGKVGFAQEVVDEPVALDLAE